MNWKDIAVRAAKTFGQAFLAVVVAAGVTSVGDIDLQLVDAAFVAGLAALASFLNNLVLAAKE
jgi:hypothetical protein